MRTVVVVVAISGAIVSARSTYEVGQSVRTSSGIVKGQASSWKKDVSEYLGVPFAEPPVSHLRWMAPKALRSPERSINAVNYSLSCAESASRASKRNTKAPQNIGASENEQSEDCLYLNIWTKPQTGEKKKAVFVWIYGGGFLLGSAANGVYTGSALAEEQDIVVVSMNYRVGVLGFPSVALPDKNLGLMDQRLAIEWIRDNIEAFGGDPGRITVAGQSAGGASADFMAYAYVNDPIVAGYIPMSGTASLSNATSRIPSNAAITNWSRLSEKLGCGGVTEDAVSKTLSCMQLKSVEAVLDATENTDGSSQMGVWGPKVDEKTVFSDTSTRLAAGNFVRRPILVGNVNNEGATRPGGGSDALQSTFGCPSAQAAKGRRDVGVPAWRYIYTAEWPNQTLGPCCPDAKGAWHGSELALIFDTTERKNKGADTAAEKVLAKKIREAWASFAKDPEHGLEKLGWPIYDSTKPSVAILGGPNDATIRFENPQVLDKQCGIA